MAKLSNQDSNGTSFHNTTVTASYNELVAAVGEPQCGENTGEDKTNFYWNCETEDGDVFTIYDYKEYRPLDLDEEVEWHIGGYDAATTEKAAEELNEILG